MADIFGIGIDVVEIGRVAKLRQRHGEKFHHLIFLPEEAEYCLARAKPDECFAARFAAKEAMMKAMGTGWADGVAFTGIEVVSLPGGKPVIHLHGSTRDKAVELGIGAIHLSLSHSNETAVAQVVAERAH